MIKLYKDDHWNQFKHCVLSMWDDRKTYEAVIIDYLNIYWYKDILNNPTYKLLVDMTDGVNGFMLSKVEDYDNRMRIVMLYVKPEFRKSGIAEKLKGRMVVLAGELRLDEVYAINETANIASLSLNIKMGWKIQFIDQYYYKSSKELK